MTATGHKADDGDRPHGALDVTAMCKELRASAVAEGIRENTFDTLTRGLEPSPRVIELAAAQPEHERSTGDYIAALVSNARIEGGRQHLRHHSQILADITAEFGVPAEILVAIWGIESNFGAAMGTNPVIQSLITLAATQPRRRAFWSAQVVAAMHIVQAGDVTPDRLVGSWAGAMGHTQFMPTTFRDHAVDFDGDGRRDIWNSFADALASAANYLKASGWQPGLAWGGEADLGSAFDFAALADDDWRSWRAWREAGVALVAAIDARKEPPPETPLQLKLPAGASGPAFLVSENFQAILTYNSAIAYALAVGHLGDRIAGARPIRAKWSSAPQLSRTERIELQQLLVDRGYDTGGVDGILGRASRQAIRAYQLRCGLCPDGFHSREVLEHLRAA